MGPTQCCSTTAALSKALLSTWLIFPSGVGKLFLHSQLADPAPLDSLHKGLMQEFLK